MKNWTVALGLFAQVAHAAAQDPLVSTEWVAQHADDPAVRIVEVSVEPAVYEKNHLRGAVGFKWHSDLCDPVGRDVVSAKDFERLCSRSGISNDTTVVLYGDLNNWFACWGYWIFEFYGHKKIKLMDGGRKKWELEKRPLDTLVPTHRPAAYRAAGPDASLRARMDEVLKVVRKETPGTLVDVRSPEEYAGKVFAPPGIQELAIRAGHIPGARNVPWIQAVREDGTFKPVEELRTLYAAAGVDGSEPVITYCRIGERSSHTWFALKVLLGYKARNYDGSWTEYGNAVGVPISNPSGTVWTGK